MANYQTYVNNVADILFEKSDYDSRFSSRLEVPPIKIIHDEDVDFSGKWDSNKGFILFNKAKRKLSYKTILSHEIAHWFFEDNEPDLFYSLESESLFDMVLNEIFPHAVSYIICQNERFLESDYKKLSGANKKKFQNKELLLQTRLDNLELTLENCYTSEGRINNKVELSKNFDKLTNVTHVYAALIAKDIQSQLEQTNFMLEPLMPIIRSHSLAKELRKYDTPYIRKYVIGYTKDILMSKFAYND